MEEFMWVFPPMLKKGLKSIIPAKQNLRKDFVHGL